MFDTYMYGIPERICETMLNLHFEDKAKNTRHAHSFAFYSFVLVAST